MSKENRYERTPEEQKRCEEMHDTSREDLLKRQLSNSEGYDKAILSLSSAGLALSLTAIRFIVPLESASYLWSIKAAWVLFLFTVISTLVAYLIGNQAISRELAKAENYYIKGIVNAHLESNIYQKINHILNKITGVLFILAISLVIGFVMCNIESNDMTDKKDTSKTIFVTDSADVPRMQAAPGRAFEASADIPTMQMAPGTPVSSGQSGAGNGNSGSSSESSEKK